MTTPAKLFAGLSAPSEKPKSAVLKVYGVSSLMPTVALVPAGASLTGVIEVAVLTSAALYAVVPPLVETSMVAAPVTAVELSIRRTDRLLGVPL